MKLVVTCGPSYEPIDQVRRITNLSTGRLGVTLTNRLSQEGWETYCFKGEGATFPAPVQAASVQTFTTNDDLAKRLRHLAGIETIHAVFHAAALCDYQVAQVLSENDEEAAKPKIASAEGGLKLLLAPAPKVLGHLRSWFPHARIVGWKYELDGTAAETLQKAWGQMEANQTDGCVLNGPAYGPGYAFCLPPDQIHAAADLDELIDQLVLWLKGPNREPA